MHGGDCLADSFASFFRQRWGLHLRLTGPTMPHCNLCVGRLQMSIVRYLVLLCVLCLVSAPGQAQQGGYLDREIHPQRLDQGDLLRGCNGDRHRQRQIRLSRRRRGRGRERPARRRSGTTATSWSSASYAYDKIKRVLAHHGATLADVVKVTTYITDLRLRGTMPASASAKPGAASPSPPTR